MRSFWFLDDITPLRQVNSDTRAAKAHLFAPEKAIRWRWNRNTDTPLPPEEPVGQNPPDGAIIDYAVQQNSGPAVLEIYDSQNKLVRRYSSEDKPEVTDAQLEKELNVPTYWIRPAHILSAAAGMHRFVWDLRYAPPKSLEHEYPIAAIYRDTPRLPRGALVLPGEYTAKLSVGGETYSQRFTVVMDPRVKTPAAGLEQQLALSLKLCEMMNRSYDSLMRARAAGGESKDLESKLSALNREIARVLDVIQGTDNAPTSQAVAAVAELEQRLSQLK